MRQSSTALQFEEGSLSDKLPWKYLSKGAGNQLYGDRKVREAEISDQDWYQCILFK